MTQQSPQQPPKLQKRKFDGDKLRYYREKADLTQKQLAEAMGMPPNQQGNVSRWEQDVVPSTMSLWALADTLRWYLPDEGITMESFIVPDEDAQEEP